MQKFRFKYTPTVWVLLFLVLALSFGGLLWNIFNLTQYLFAGAFKIVVYSLIILLTSLLTAFVISIMVMGRYVIKNGYLYTQFGFVFEKCKIEDVSDIVHHKKSDKLVVYFTDKKFTFIVVSPLEYERFIKAMRSENTKITFSSADEDQPLNA